jgi:hypothetical protein
MLTTGDFTGSGFCWRYHNSTRICRSLNETHADPEKPIPAVRHAKAVSTTTLVAAYVSLALMGLPLLAQVAPNQAIPTRAAIPRQSDGKPDFTGVWAGRLLTGEDVSA